MQNLESMGNQVQSLQMAELLVHVLVQGSILIYWQTGAPDCLAISTDTDARPVHL